MKLKTLLLAAAIGMAASSAMAQVSTPEAKVISPDDQHAYIPQGTVDASLSGRADLHLHTTGQVMVEGCWRDKAGGPEMHTHLTDFFYITQGQATLIVGGKLEGGKTVRPGQVRGGTIVGGKAYEMVKGDVMVIPPGIPHQWAKVPASVSYLVFKRVDGPGA